MGGNCTSMSSPSSECDLRRPTPCYSSCSPPKAKVICVDGRVEEYEAAVLARHVAAESPGYCVCNAEAMEVGARPPVVAEAEELQPGQVYFLLPISYSRRLLSLPDLCLFAAMASPALRRCH